LEGHWLSSMPADQRFDLIVSNPPYLAAHDPHLPGLRHEPRQALVSGEDGLDDIRTLIHQAPGHLKPGGWLLLEHGHDQSQAVQALLRQAGFDQVQSRPDLAGISRCTGGLWPAVK
jgi:release factor glutamine methyltransferase